MLYVWLTKRVLIASLTCAIILFVVSMVLTFVVFPKIIRSQVHDNVELENGTDQWDRFVNTPFALQFKLSLFNITNLDGVKKGDTPYIEDVGPYIYSEIRNKTILEFNSNDTVTYQQNETFSYDQTATSSNLNPYTDNIVTLNPAYLAVMDTLSEALPDLGFLFERILDEIFPQGLFINVHPQDILWDGYDFCINNNPNKSLSFIGSLACGIIAGMGKRNIDTYEHKLTFSYFNFKNNKYDGLYVVNRGIDDKDATGSIEKWNHVKYTSFWQKNHTECDLAEGTDSTIFPPDDDKDTILKVYTTDVCRMCHVLYTRKDKYKSVHGLRYELSKAAYNVDNPKSSCFCTYQTKNTSGQPSCYMDGVIDFQPCSGAPILASQPYFYGGSDLYLKPFKNLKADPSKHQTYVLLEPYTGTPLQGHKQLQLNAVLRPYESYTQTENFTRVVLPLVWIDEGVDLDNDYIDLLDHLLFNKLKIVHGVQWALVALSSFATLVLSFLLVWRLREPLAF